MLFLNILLGLSILMGLVGANSTLVKREDKKKKKEKNCPLTKRTSRLLTEIIYRHTVQYI